VRSGWKRGDAPALADLAGRRLQDAGDALEERALARAVVTEEPDGLALVDGEVDVPERPELLVVTTAELEHAFFE
jgi:hypothetical protein